MDPEDDRGVLRSEPHLKRARVDPGEASIWLMREESFQNPERENQDLVSAIDAQQREVPSVDRPETLTAAPTQMAGSRSLLG